MLIFKLICGAILTWIRSQNILYEGHTEPAEMKKISLKQIRSIRTTEMMHSVSETKMKLPEVQRQHSLVN